MSTDAKTRPVTKDQPPRRVTKKEQIVSLFTSGVTDLEAIADIVGARPSYVAGVLQEQGLMTGYFDLYTSSAQPMNVYSQLFAGQLGFKDLDAARRSVELLDQQYRHFEETGDRAGQHHALMMALTMFDRARWINKPAEAEPFRLWLLHQLEEAGVAGTSPKRAVSKVARR